MGQADGDTENPDVLGDMKFVNIDIPDQRENQIAYKGCLALNAGDSSTGDMADFLIGAHVEGV